MTQQVINIGAVADDGTGDTVRVGGDKINDNFTELYAAVGRVISALSTNSTISASHTVALVNATAGNITITLASAASLQHIVVKKVDASANTVTVDANGSQTIDGSLTAVLTTQFESITLISDGTNWSII